MTDKPMIPSEATAAGRIAQSMGAADRCPKCGAYVEEGDEIDHVVDGDCERIRLNGEIEYLRRQLAQAQAEIERFRAASLNALAAECYRLAVARGEYPSVWTLIHGCIAIEREMEEWWRAGGNPKREAEEMGDLFATVLSIAHHRVIDVEAALECAIQRNRERAGRNE